MSLHLHSWNLIAVCFQFLLKYLKPIYVPSFALFQLQARLPSSLVIHCSNLIICFLSPFLLSFNPFSSQQLVLFIKFKCKFYLKAFLWLTISLRKKYRHTRLSTNCLPLHACPTSSQASLPFTYSSLAWPSFLSTPKTVPVS